MEMGKVKSAGDTLKRAIWATVLWLLFGVTGPYIFARYPAGCAGTYSCLTVEGWGTYLAGITAPIAFFWLAAAVFIQSKELAAQREELRLTRLEFAANRTVMEAQATEARHQARFIGEQTTILRNQEKAREDAEAWLAFENAIALLAMRLENYDHVWTFYFTGQGEHSFRKEGYLGKDAQATVVGAAQSLRRFIRDRGPLPINLTAAFPIEFHLVYSTVTECCKMGDFGTNAIQQQVDALELNSLRDGMAALITASPNLQREAENKRNRQ